MTIDFWGLGLQAVNVLILVWLLSHFFWRPVAAAIAKRQKATTSMIDAAKATQAKAAKALDETTKARAGIEEERTATLNATRKEAEIATKATLAETRAKADAMITAAKTAAEQDSENAKKENATQAAELAMKIAAKLLERLNGQAAQAAFLTQLADAIAALAAADQKALLDDPKGIEIVSASALDAEKKDVERAVHTALGGKPDLKFVIDPDLIGGLEMRSQHFVLHNSWQADLKQLQKTVHDAA